MKVVSIQAVDWSIDTESHIPAQRTYAPVKGWLHGEVVHEDDDCVSLAHQTFSDGGVRWVVTIPKVCIIKRVDHAVIEAE